MPEDTPETLAPGPRATRREWIGLAVIALPCLLYSMDLTVLNLAVPTLTADLRPSAAQLLWIVDIYGFLVAGSLITMGTLGDRIGRRRLLMIGAAVFGLASLLAAFANTAETLIAARALLGVAGATVAPSTLSLIRNMFHDPQQRTFAISVWITSYSVGGAIGPLLGGVMLQHFWWGSVFLLAVPVMVLLLIVAPILLPEYRDPQAGRLDLASAVLSLVAVLAAIYGVKMLAEHGPGWPPLLWILAGLAVGTVFIRRQARLDDPLIDLRLFRSPAFGAALAVNVLGLFAVFGTFLFVAQYLQLVLGLSPLEAGLWTLPSSLAFVAGSMLTPMALRRTRPVVLMAGGLMVAAAGFLALTLVDHVSSPALLAGAAVVFATGLSPVFTLTTDLIVGAAPPERAGSAAAISETGAEFGGALGIAVLGCIATALYRGVMADGVPAGVPPEAAEAARATLGGALAAARELPDETGRALADAARGAFTHAFGLAALVSAGIAVAAAVLAATVLGPPRRGAEAHATE
ncbi:MFS transporter [Inquilinus sp. Marseille-Q2685]|uniref:MFS transporter n=1 Tax=Inquilinus sp. Marseille-Q2685 TaxID=2866581 RepID=UPI001CE49FDB|nr:MFS transporter [Inquilinus sp. Marseille-Q2685]